MTNNDPEDPVADGGTAKSKPQIPTPTNRPALGSSSLLIPKVADCVNDSDPVVDYLLLRKNTNCEIEHIFAEDNLPRVALRRMVNKFFLYESYADTDLESDPLTYEDFETAFARFIETLEFQTLPKAEPFIWGYQGYTDTQEDTIIDYLSETRNNRIDHVFHNTAAGYSVVINTYELSDTTPDNFTTIFTILSPRSGKQTFSQTTDGLAYKSYSDTHNPLYRKTFAGQRDAFEFFVGLLQNDLSKTIQNHNGDIGNPNTIKPVEEILTSSHG